MGEWKLSWKGRFRLPVRSGEAGVDLGHLRSQDDSSVAKALGRRRAIPWRSDFVDEKTISPAEIGGLVRALIVAAAKAGEMDWTDQVYFLRSER